MVFALPVILWQMALNGQKQKLPASKVGTKVGTPGRKVGTVQKVGTRPETSHSELFFFIFPFYFLLPFYHYLAAFLAETYAIFFDNHIPFIKQPCIIMFIFYLLKRLPAHAFHFCKPLYMFKFKYYSRLLFIIRL